MTVVGVTGKYCAGKDTVTEILRESGYLDIDVDALGHDALVGEKHAVVDEFGPSVASPDGSVDRRALGRRVFSDPEALRTLEAIVHPVMKQVVVERIAAARESASPPPGVVVNAAVLVRMGLAALCDTVIYVHAPLCVRYRRARSRDGARLLAVMRRLAAQRDVSPQFSLPDADIQSVKNDGSRDQLRAKLRSVLSLP